MESYKKIMKEWIERYVERWADMARSVWITQFVPLQGGNMYAMHIIGISYNKYIWKRNLYAMHIICIL